MHQRFSTAICKCVLRDRFHRSLISSSSFSSQSLSTGSFKASADTCAVSGVTLSREVMFHYLNLSNSIASSNFSGPHSIRNFCAQPSADFDKDRVVDEINLKFTVAREEVEAAMDSKETVYFNEEAECARAAVKEVLDMFEGLLGKLDGKEKNSVQRSMGLKMEQLKAELQQLND